VTERLFLAANKNIRLACPRRSMPSVPLPGKPRLARIDPGG